MIHLNKHMPSCHAFKKVQYWVVFNQSASSTTLKQWWGDRVWELLLLLLNKLTPLNKHSSLSFSHTFAPWLQAGLNTHTLTHTHTTPCLTLRLNTSRALGGMEMPDEIFMMLLLLDARHDATYDARNDDTPSHASCVRTANRTGISPQHFFINPQLHTS